MMIRRKGIDSYLVAKYGNKWAITRTVVDNSTEYHGQLKAKFVKLRTQLLEPPKQPHMNSERLHESMESFTTVNDTRIQLLHRLSIIEGDSQGKGSGSHV
ncbi:hypothetical protein YC2023_071465 [Brassica napus]